MSRKERIEDLGRLSVMLNDMWHHDLFNLPVWTRPKDAPAFFFSLNTEQQESFIHDLAYMMESLHDKISDCSIIASGLEDEITEL